MVPFECLPLRCFRYNGYSYLIAGPNAPDWAGLLDTHAFAPVYARYAYRRVGTRQLFFPTVAADDRGQLHKGLELMDWLSNFGLLYPRADTEGVWLDGREDQLFIKELDLGEPQSVYVSAGGALFPGERLAAAIELSPGRPIDLAEGGDFPERIKAAVPALRLRAGLAPYSAMALLEAYLGQKAG